MREMFLSDVDRAIKEICLYLFGPKCTDTEPADRKK